jgi:hypothetical protein
MSNRTGDGSPSGWVGKWGVGKWGRVKKKSKRPYLSRGDNHDMTPFLMLRLPRLTILRLPLHLHGLCTLRLLGQGCALRVGGLR